MKKSGLDDSALVINYKNGDDNAFAELLNRHKTKVFTTILIIVKDHYLAEDLMQDTFVKAVKTIKSGRYNEEGKFLPWVIRIAHNLAIDYFRKEKRYPEVDLDDHIKTLNNMYFSEDSAEATQIKKETYSRLRMSIQQLPEKQREVLIMRHYAEMSFQEIADVTDVSVNTALGRMRYALINLRKQMIKNPLQYDKDAHP